MLTAGVALIAALLLGGRAFEGARYAYHTFCCCGDGNMDLANKMLTSLVLGGQILMLLVFDTVGMADVTP